MAEMEWIKMRTIEDVVLAIAPMMSTDNGEVVFIGTPEPMKAAKAYGYAIQVEGRMIYPDDLQYDTLVAPLGVLPTRVTCWVCGHGSMPMATTTMCMRCVHKAVNG